MRVGSSSMYTNFNHRQQNILQQFKNEQDKFATGKKIQYGHQNLDIFNDTLRLDYERYGVLQVKDNTNKAKHFAKNTDDAIKAIKDAVTNFKTKLIQGNNATQSTTSRQAIVAELKALRKHILNLSNQSINGKYIFSGTNMSTKPFAESGDYRGNQEQMKTVIGSNNKIAYNIDGYNLFMGFNTDYKKIITTNVKHFNKVDQYPSSLNDKNPNAIAKETPLKPSSTIKEYIGQKDDDKITYFYIRGKRPDGFSVKEQIKLNNDSSIEDLLYKIGKAFGNTEVFKTVDVTLSNHGQIKISDAKSGQMLTDFHMVATDKDMDDLDDLATAGDAHIFEFNKSKFAYEREYGEVNLVQSMHDQRRFRASGLLLTQGANEFPNKETKVQAVFGKDTDKISLNINGKTYTHSIIPSDAIKDLYSKIAESLKAETGHDFDVDLSEGRLVVVDTSASAPSKNESDPDYVKTTLKSISIGAQRSDGTAIKSFSALDGVSYDNTKFAKKGNTLTSNVSQVVKSTSSYATAADTLSSVAGHENLDEKVYRFNLTDTNGVSKIMEINLRTRPTLDGKLSTFQIVEPASERSQVFDIFDDKGNVTGFKDYNKIREVIEDNKFDTKVDKVGGFTYKQLFSVMKMVVSDNLPKDNNLVDFQSAIKASEDHVEIKFDRQSRIEIKDLTGKKSQVELSIEDTDSSKFKDYIKRNDKSGIKTFTGIKQEQGWSLANTNETVSLDKAFGFKFQELEVTGTDKDGNAATLTVSQDENLKTLMQKLDDTFGDGASKDINFSIQDGILMFQDTSNANPTNVNLKLNFKQSESKQVANMSSALTFMANNALTIDKPQNDFFATLDAAIAAVAFGDPHPGSENSDPRNTGVTNSIKAIDHVLDQVIRKQTENGANQNSIEYVYDKTLVIEVNIKTLKSSILDVDMGEAFNKVNRLKLSYEALLSSISKINGLSLVNYL